MPSSERTTMAKMAEQSGVSLATVSLVLRDEPGVGSDTRQWVLDVAGELGDIPKNLAALYAPILTSISA